MSDDFSPADALAAVQAQRDKLAEDAASPRGYHLILALAAGVLIASPFWGSLWVVAVVYVAFFLILWGLVTWYKRSKGMWINGLDERPARRYSATAGAIGGGGFAASLVAEWFLHLHGASLVLAVIAVPTMTWLGYRWDAAYEQELRESA